MLRVTEKTGQFLWQVVQFEGDSLSEEQLSVIETNVEAMCRCLFGDHSIVQAVCRNTGTGAKHGGVHML